MSSVCQNSGSLGKVKTNVIHSTKSKKQDIQLIVQFQSNVNLVYFVTVFLSCFYLLLKPKNAINLTV